MKPPAGRLLAASSLALLCHCTARKPLTLHDAGPAVEVVDASRPPASSRNRVPLIDEKEPDNSVESAQPLAAGSGIRGFVGAPHPGKGGKLAGDDDYYSWMAPGGGGDLGGGFATARVELGGVPGLDLQLELLDGDGKRLLVAHDGGPGDYQLVPNLAVEPAHTYYVRVHEAGVPHGDATHAYELTIATTAAGPGDEREPNDDIAHASGLVFADSATGIAGELSGLYGRNRDEDWVRVRSLRADAGSPVATTLRVELEPVEGVAAAVSVQTAGTPPVLLAEARGAKGEELRLRNVDGVSDGGGDLALIRVRALAGRSDLARWRLRVGLEAPLGAEAEREPNNSIASATPLQLGSGLAGFLWPGDRDLFHVVGGTPASPVTVELEGVDKVDLKLEQLDAAGKVVASADANRVGQGEKLAVPLGDGYFRVSARAHDSAFDAPYRLTVRAADQ